MGLISEVVAILRADNSDFRSKMDQAGGSVEKLDKSLKKFGLGFGGVAALATAFRAIVDHARDLTGELDENERRAQQFAKGLDEAKKGALNVGVQVLGVVNGLGEWMGRQIAILKYGRDQVELNEKIAKEAEENIAAGEKNKKIIEEVNRIKAQTAEVEKKRNEFAVRQLDITEQIALAEKKLFEAAVARTNTAGDKVKLAKADLEFANARMEVDKLTAEQAKKNAEDEKKAATDRQKSAESHIETMDRLAELEFERLSAAGKIDVLAKEEKQIIESINKAKAEGRDTSKMQVALLEAQEKLGKLRKGDEQVVATTLDEQLDVLKKQGTSREQIIATLISQGHSEDEILKKLEAQTQEIQRQITIRRSGQDYEDQTEVALEGVRSRVQSQLDAVRRQNAMLPISQRNPMEIALQSELDQINREINARRNISNFANRYGEDAARFKYGDTLTDRALRAMQDEQTKTRVTIEQLLEAFRKSVASTPR